jgi:tetratricopeptide (TPR) repeat protein
MPAFLPCSPLSLPSQPPHPPWLPKRPRSAVPVRTFPRACAPPPANPALSRAVEAHLQQTSSSPPPDAPPGPHAPIALPVQLDLLTYHARVAVRRRCPEEAERLLRRALAINAADGRAWLALARIFANKGNVVDARRLFKAGVGASRKNPYLLQAWGVFEEKAGNLERAKGLYETATRADPTHCASWVALGLWEQRIGRDFYAARECFQKGATADPDNYYVWHVWGVLEKEARDYDAARECFRAGVKANSRNAATYVVWGVLEEQLRNHSTAVDLFERAHKANPKNAHALVAHAVAADRAGDNGKARDLLDTALEVRPKDAAIYQAYGLLEARVGMFDAARDLFRRGTEVDPKHTPVWLAWGVMEDDTGDSARARELFQEGVWANPRSATVVRLWHAWAGLERRQGNIAAARKLFGHGLRANPDSVAVLSCWAAMEAEESPRTANMKFARDMLERAVLLEPEHRDLWYLYESLEREYGSSERAADIAARALAMSCQTDRRFVVSDPLPGDFAAGGMWIDAADVRVTSADVSVSPLSSALASSDPIFPIASSLPTRTRVDNAREQTRIAAQAEAKARRVKSTASRRRRRGAPSISENAPLFASPSKQGQNFTGTAPLNSRSPPNTPKTDTTSLDGRTGQRCAATGRTRLSPKPLVRRRNPSSLMSSAHYLQRIARSFSDDAPYIGDAGSGLRV